MNRLNARSLRCLFGAWLVVFLTGKSASAQISPFASIAQPGSGAADGAEPWAVVLNPASLAEARDFLFGLRHSEVSPGLFFTGRGTGLYAARPLPYLNRIVLGGGLELLRPGTPMLPELYGKLTLDLAYSVLPELSLGLGYGHLFAPSTPPSYDGLDTVSLGARLTVGRYVALGLVLHDLSAPRPRDPTALLTERSYELEMLTRFVGNHRLELGAGLRVGEETHTLWPRFRLWARPLAGLGLSVEGALALRPDSTDPAPSRLDYRIGLGLTLDFAHIGASGFVLFGNGTNRSAPDALALSGGSAALRLSFERYPALWEGPGRVYKVELGAKSSESILRLLAALRSLERDPRARGVVLLLNGLGGGYGVADELRQAILRLRKSGKRVIAYGADFTQREFYVAAAAERIYLDPMGSIRLGGIAHSGFFFKEAIERLGVRADLIRIGQYKSSPEMWTRNEPSDPARAQRQSLIDELYERLCMAIAEGRRLDRAQATERVEHGLYSARAAVTAGLVDAIATAEQVELALYGLLGEQVPIATLDRFPEHKTSYAPPGVAVVQIEGDLIDGRSRKVPLVDLRVAGGQTLSEALLEVQRDPQVRAVVLRIDSPGGSALAADLLARQVAELSREKPVICSFGDVAASGGYYLAAPCTLIYTNPSTLTGSIGIFGGKVDISGLTAFLGVHRVTLQRGNHAELESPFRPYSDAERAMVQERLQQGYDRFIETVANGRHLALRDVEARAQGRVWSGAQAVAQKLADRNGGLLDAVAEARRRAGLSPEGDSPLFYYPRQQPNLLVRLLGLPPNLFKTSAAEPPALWRILSAASDLLPGLRTALLLLDSEVLMLFEGASPH